MKKVIFERIVVPNVLYGVENFREKMRLNVMELKRLRSIYGVTVRDVIRNEEIRRVGTQVDQSERV